MGLSFSCPLATYTDIENGFESLTVKSIIFGNGEEKTPCRSISFKGEDTEPTIMRSTDSGKMRIEGSVSFRIRGNDFTRSNKACSFEEKTSCLPSYDKCEEMYNECSRSYSDMENMRDLSLFGSMSPKDEAAVKLQKVYKSFRTRRKLADCAVLIEQSWWKLLDFAELKRSSISFFELDKQETAISRWSRARTRAAKVGKGLSKNSKAQKLALQHWLEAIDPRHRYGHNLHIYYDKWLHSQSREPFFYWLDIGEGKEVNLVEKCPRWKLHQQCIKYLGPMERKNYEVQMENGRLLYKQTGEFVDTTSEPKGAKWIFVLSTSRTLYVGIKKKGSFQHSSFLAGGATLAAGRIVAERGVLKAIWPHSGHYRPTKENFEDFISFLKENNVDIRDVKTDSVDDDKESLVKQGSIIHLSNNSSEEEMSEKERMDTEEKADSVKDAVPLSMEPPKLKLTTLEIPNRDDFLETLKSENGHKMAEEMQAFASSKQYASDDESEPALEENIPDESILQRINSHKGTESYQLGRQLSCKWSTGAGPRIGCLRDYPSELQSHALEQANLSPRSACVLRSNSNHRVNASPKSFFARINSRPYRTQSSPFSMEASETAFNEPS